MKIIIEETPNKFNLFSVWCPFLSTRNLIICLKLPTEARSVFWGILAQKRFLQTINIWMRNRRDLCFQHRPHQKPTNQAMQEVKSHWKMTFVSILNFYWGGESCWKVKNRSLNFFHIFKSWNQNIVNEKVSVDLNHIFNENQS